MAEKVALITGGLSGIGLEIAKALTDTEHVLLADVSSENRLLLDPRFTPLLLDVTDDTQWDEVRRVIEELGRLDYLVFSAGIAPILSVAETTTETARNVMDVNVSSILTGVRMLWEVIVRSQTSIVIVGSVAGLVGQNKAAAYVASKGAVISLTRALAIELAPHGVRVNCVAPGPTDTAMIRRHFASLSDPDRSRRELERRMPLGRLLTAEEIAHPVIFLLSQDAASGVNGTTLVIDGGLTATFDFGSEFAGGDYAN